MDSRVSEMARKSIRQIKGEIYKSIRDGDLDQLATLLPSKPNVSEFKAVIESLITANLDEYYNYVSKLLKTSKNPKQEPSIWVHVLHEMLLRAYFISPKDYLKISSKFPYKHYVASMNEAKSVLKEGVPSFSDSDYLKAKEIFTTFYENYKKSCEVFLRIAEIISTDSPDTERVWNSTFPDAHCRYACLGLDATDTLIRNAISHKTIRRLKDGKFELTGRKKGERRIISADTLDKRLNLLLSRIESVNIALNLIGTTTYSNILSSVYAMSRDKVE